MKNAFLCMALVVILLIPVFSCAFSEEAVLQYSYGNEALNKHMLDLPNTTAYNGAKWAFEHRAFSFESDFVMYGGNTRTVFEFEVPENVWTNAVESGQELYLGRAEIAPNQKMDLYVFSGDRTTGKYVLTESRKNIGSYATDVFATYDEFGTLRLIDKVFLYTCLEDGAKKNYAAGLYVCFENYDAAPADTSSQVSKTGDSSASENAADTKDGRLQAYAETIRTLEEENSRLKEEMEGLKARVSQGEELREQVDALYEEIEAIYAELQMSHDVNGQLEAEIAALEAEAEKGSCLLSDSVTEVSALGKAESARSVKEEAAKGVNAYAAENPQDNGKKAIISGRNNDKSEGAQTDEDVDYSVVSDEELYALHAENAERLKKINDVLGKRARESALTQPVEDALGTIRELFPDEILACYVRDKLSKFSIDQPVTQAELDTITSIYFWATNEYPRDLTGIGHLRNLRGCTVGSFYGNIIPEDMRNCKQLESIYFLNSSVEAIPEWIGELTMLKTIEINRGTIREIPESIGNLVRLERLTLENNKIEVIPDSIANCIALKTLDLENNNISAIPDSMWSMKFDSLVLSGNPIR